MEHIDSGTPISQMENREELAQILSNERLARKLISVDSRNLKGEKYRYSMYELLA